MSSPLPLAGLSQDTIAEFVNNYLDKVHGGCHSIFHPDTLRTQLRQGTVNKTVLYAICALGSKFAADNGKRAAEDSLAAEAKRLLHADLENICIENVQACIVLAALSSGNSQPSSGALYIRIAVGMAELLHLGQPRSFANQDSILTHETSRRIWWSLYIAERWCFSGLGLRCRMDDADHYQEGHVPPMDDFLFFCLSAGDPNPSSIVQKPGLWSFMIKLTSYFGSIQDLNRQIATGGLLASATKDKIKQLGQQLEDWHRSIPLDMQMTAENLERWIRKGLARPFVSLHLTYHHFSTLLYFHFLEEQHRRPTLYANACNYVARCKHHATSFSSLLSLSRQATETEINYSNVGHMIVVSSSVLVHTLLFGDMHELPEARQKLNSNFDALMRLRRYWPATTAMVTSSILL
ncbi:C6 transcription factor [Colletotrichum truncatum]|uniref:C6 transcription factor n=1 Tax=Colletotrichum truncatum TaxID=5467 RepID=A0ACC3YPN7_COLTU